MCFSQRTVPLQLRRAPSLDSSRDERAGSVDEAEELGGDENGQAEHAEDDPENERVERASELAFLVGERVDVRLNQPVLLRSPFTSFVNLSIVSRCARCVSIAFVTAS